MSDLIEVPRTALARLVAVAAHVSLGARAAFTTPHPDSLARLALGELHDAGLLPVADADVAAEFEAHAEESLALANEAFDAVAESWPKE